MNHGAAALVLAVTALADEVIVSRGELVEIGDGFRVGELVASTGARLVEVGATNRTHLRDYAEACRGNRRPRRPVSYTHLDVYKRQSYDNTGHLGPDTWRHVAFIEQGPDQLAAARASGRRLLTISPVRHLGGFGRRGFYGLSCIRVVLLSGWGGLAADSSGRLLVIDEAPHDWLCPRSAGVCLLYTSRSGAAAPPNTCSCLLYTSRCV